MEFVTQYLFPYDFRSTMILNETDVTTVTPTNYFNFTPLLASCSVGTLELGTAIEPVSRIKIILLSRLRAYVSSP